MVESVDELPQTKTILLDITPRQVNHIAGHRLPARYLGGLRRYRYGPGVFKICLLYPSDAADDPLCVDLCSRRFSHKHR